MGKFMERTFKYLLNFVVFLNIFVIFWFYKNNRWYKARQHKVCELFFFFKIFFKKTIVKKGQTCYNLFKVKEGQKDKT